MHNIKNIGTGSTARPRNGGVEVLRCLLMFLIVLWHNWHYGVYFEQASGGTEVWWTLIFTALIIWHVDGFVAISGWFGIKFNPQKFFKLLVQILFYSGLSLAYWIWTDPATLPRGLTAIYRWSPRLVDAGWFGGCYLMLMLVAPFVNAGIETLHEQGRLLKAFFWAVAGMACAWAPQCALTGIMPSGLGRCSFITVLFVYFVARSARLGLGDRYIALWKLMLGVGLYFLSTVAAAGIWVLYLRLKSVPFGLDPINIYWDYYAPQVVACAVAIVILFAHHVRVPEWLGRVAGFLGPSMFGVYLIHDVTKFGKFYVPVQKWLVAQYDPHPLTVLLAAAVVTFGVCVAIDLVRRGVFCGVGAVWKACGRFWPCRNVERVGEGVGVKSWSSRVEEF